MSTRIAGYEFDFNLVKFLKKNRFKLNITDELAEKVARKLQMESTPDLNWLSREEIFDIDCLDFQQRTNFWNMVQKLKKQATFMDIIERSTTEVVNQAKHMYETSHTKNLKILLYQMRQVNELYHSEG
jgi:actin-like ATPase involved in cell morphogenesis